MDSEKPGAHKLSSFARALKKGGIQSDVVEFPFNGETCRIRFREISQDRIDRMRFSSIQWVEENRRRQEGKKHEWRDVQGDLDSLRANELDLRMLHYAMVDAETGDPLASLQEFRDGLNPEWREHLAAAHRVFMESISPDTMDLSDVEAMAEDLKKNEVDPVWLVMQYGYKTLIACSRYLAVQLESYETEKLTPTSSGEPPPLTSELQTQESESISDSTDS